MLKGFINKRTDAGSPTRVILSAFSIFIISQFIALFIAELILSLVKSAASFDNSIAAQFMYVLIAEGLALAFTLKLIKVQGLKPSFIGLGRRPQLRDLTKAAKGFVIFYGLIIVINVLVNLFAPSINNQPQDLGFNSLKGAGDGILAFIALVILPPLGEEPLVRGYLYSGLRARWRYVPAMLVTSLLFGIAHLEFGNGPLVWGAGLETFALSLVLIYLRESTGALYAGALVHLVNNLIAFGVHFHI